MNRYEQFWIDHGPLVLLSLGFAAFGVALFLSLSQAAECGKGQCPSGKSPRVVAHVCQCVEAPTFPGRDQ